MLAGHNHSLVVVGGASLDRLHFHGRSHRSAGGAGLYTALAAVLEGARVTMVGPRPQPMPSELELAAGRIDWRGPVVSPEEMPFFEIVHEGDGHSKMVDVEWRAEARLTPDHVVTGLPAGPAFVIALEDPERQLGFVHELKAQGRTVGCGTFLGAIDRNEAAVRRVLAESDLFFCNQVEADRLFDGSEREVAPGRLLFVTGGSDGVFVVQGAHVTRVPAPAVSELDPTGAGDTFCGTVLAALMRGEHPVMAARLGVVAAAEMIQGVGPEKLLKASGPFEVCTDRRVVLDPARIARIGKRLGGTEEVGPFDFVGDLMPPRDDPAALDFFFAATLQQFGFWHTKGRRYREPLVARVFDRALKGSDYLWAVYKRWLMDRPAGLTPGGQAVLEASEFDRSLRADDEGNPLDATGSMGQRLALANAYGRTLSDRELDPAAILSRAKASNRPLAAFLAELDHIGGYREDPLRKKTALLAAILSQRPERFLEFGDDEDLPPIVDYHVQRSCLRIGLVEVVDPDLSAQLERRELLDLDAEWAVREACYRAVEELRRVSGRSMGAIDWFLFQNRKRCPEMSEPLCDQCPLDPGCAHRKTLFQPVYRTSFY